METYYFDHNATTPLNHQALKAWLTAQEKHWHNPSTLYRAGTTVHVLIEKARERIARLLGTTCRPEDIIFTSGATEAINASLHYFKKLYPDTAHVLISTAEHSAVTEATRQLFQDRFEELPLNSSGELDIEYFQNKLSDCTKKSPTMVWLCAVHNETGVLQPWKQVAELCKAQGALFCCDASQWLGKLPAVGLDQADLLIGTGHKWGGPKGVGFIKINPATAGLNIQFGGEQESGHRAGTENYPAIEAMTVALEVTDAYANDYSMLVGKEMERGGFELLLLKDVKGSKILGAGASRLWNTSAILMPKMDSAQWVQLLDQKRFQIATGSACKSAKELRSSVWGALHLTEAESSRVLRISGGWGTMRKEWSLLEEAITNIWQHARGVPPISSSGYSTVIDVG